MTDRQSTWRRIQGDGAEWEVRILPGPGRTDGDDDEEVLEFVCVDGSRKSRQVAVPAGAYPAMDEAGLQRAFLQARPIGGDHYGRPGKHMNDAR